MKEKAAGRLAQLRGELNDIESELAFIEQRKPVLERALHQTVGQITMLEELLNGAFDDAPPEQPVQPPDAGRRNGRKGSTVATKADLDKLEKVETS